MHQTKHGVLPVKDGKKEAKDGNTLALRSVFYNLRSTNARQKNKEKEEIAAEVDEKEDSSTDDSESLLSADSNVY